MAPPFNLHARMRAGKPLTTPDGTNRIYSERLDASGDDGDEEKEPEVEDPEAGYEPIWKRRRLSARSPHQQRQRRHRRQQQNEVELVSGDVIGDVEGQLQLRVDPTSSALRKYCGFLASSPSLADVRVQGDCVDGTAALSGTSLWLSTEPRRCNGNITAAADGISVVSMFRGSSLPTIESLAAAAASSAADQQVSGSNGEECWLQHHPHRKLESSSSSAVERLQAAASRRGKTFPKLSPTSTSIDGDVDHVPSAATSGFAIRTPLSMLRYLVEAVRRFVADPACSFLRRRRRRSVSGKEKSNMASLLAAASTHFVVDKRLRDDFRFLDDYGNEAVRKEMMIDDATIVAEWRELARVLDRLFFWLIFGLMTASAIIILLYPKYTGNETGWYESDNSLSADT